MKCQRCMKQSTYHITEIHGSEQSDDVHLCEDCAKKYLSEPQLAGPSPGPKATAKTTPAVPSDHGAKQCDVCGLKFVEFRNTGRLGCPDDYDEFRDDLLPLLESIHGDVKHAGKTPRRPTAPRSARAELTHLRKQLARAVTDEAYEEAARLRDQIKELEDA